MTTARRTVELVLPCGPVTLDIQLTSSPAVVSALEARLGGWSSTRSSRRISVCLDATSNSAFHDGEALAVSHAAQQVRRLELEVVRLDSAGWHARSLIAPGPAENALRWIAAWELLHDQTLSLHACSATLRGHAHVFLGASGAGKTTVARGGGMGAVLTDELSFVGRRSGRWYAYTSPFWGSESTPPPRAARAVFEVPVAAVWQLTGRTADWAVSEVAPLTGASAVLALLERQIELGGLAGSDNAALELAETLATEVPLQQLLWSRRDPLTQIIDEPTRSEHDHAPVRSR